MLTTWCAVSDSWMDCIRFANWYFTQCMPPVEIAKCPGHPLNTELYLGTLKDIYEVDSNGIWTGDVASEIEYTISDCAIEVGNAMMRAFPKAKHLNCNVHHLVKGFGSAGGLRKKVKEDMTTNGTLHKPAVEPAGSSNTTTATSSSNKRKRKREQQDEEQQEEEEEQPTSENAKGKKKKTKQPIAENFERVIQDLKNIIWAMSRLHHGTMHQFFDSRELLYAEYGDDLPSFVKHHMEYYGPGAPMWRQRWSRCFTTWGIPIDDNCRYICSLVS